jgi:hypothetical protein
MDNIKYYLNHTIYKFKLDIDENIKNICKNPLELEKLPTFSKRLIISNNDLAIKFIDYNIHNINNKFSNTEIFLINEYLENKLVHEYFIPYIAIINIVNIEAQTNISSEEIGFVDNKTTVLNIKDMDIGVIMPKYTPLEKYLFVNDDLSHTIILNNINNILDLAIFIRDKYSIIHADVKLDNIVVNNDKFYLIDWECIFEVNETYYHEERPTEGNTEMYPHYDADSEEFFVYSIGVLIVRIIGFHYGVTYKDFTEHYTINYILSKIPKNIRKVYEDLLITIFVVGIKKIELLKAKISRLLEN